MAVIFGTNSGESINGTAANDTIHALAGNDILFGDTGLDILNGGNGNDRFDITDQSQIVAGETYNGGNGFDTLFLNTASPINLTGTTISSVEGLFANGEVSLNAAQLGAFLRVQTGAITLNTGGLADLSNNTVFTGTFNLNAAGNTFTLAGVTNIGYTVNGNIGVDVITGGENGDGLNGGDNNDTLNGAGGNDTLVGGNGRDTVDGGTGNDRMVITAQAEIVAGESYVGGTGFDTLDLETVSPIDISSLTINIDVERLESNGPVSLTNVQLNAFKSVQTGVITLTTGGNVNFTGDTIITNNFTLNAAGNNINFTGQTATGYTVNGGIGVDVITGGDLGDALFGGDNNDTLNGAYGNDFLVGGNGQDTIDGGVGDDRMSINNQAEIVAGESYVGGTGFDILDLETVSTLDISSLTINADVERLESSGEVFLTAAQLTAFKTVQTGVITLTTGGAVSFVDDTVFTSTFNLNAAGNSLNLNGVTNSFYTINGGAGIDTITGGENGDALLGGDNNDTLNGAGGGDTLIGGAGRDTVNGGDNNDRMVINLQTEIVAGESYSGGTGFDFLDLETGADINISSLTINADVERLESGGTVSLTAAQLDAFDVVQTGAMTLTTAGAVSFLDNTVFTNTFFLNAGGNTLDLTGVTNTNYTVNGAAGVDIISGGEGHDTLNGGGANDTINGNGGNDTITGGAGSDTVNAGNGDDRMVITLQTDIVAGESYVGGVGFDVLDLETAAAINIASLSINIDVERLESNGSVSMTAAQLNAFKSIQTGAITLTTAGAVNFTNDTVFTNIFNLNAGGNALNLAGLTNTNYTVNGGAGIDLITGSENVDALNGGGNNDTLTGGAGNDTLTGGTGSDTVDGGVGDDRMVITAPADIAAGESYVGGSGFDTLDLETAAAVNIAGLTINADVERLESNGIVSLSSAQLNAFKNVQTGAITLTSGGGVSFVNDTVFTNTFNLNAAGNNISFSGVVDTGYTVNGNAGVDNITGGDNNDTLIGGGNNDTLNGSFGNDTLTGGVGQDSYLFNTGIEVAFTNRDNITDFTVVDDTILLSQSVFAAAGAIGVLAAAAFRTGAAAADASDRIIYNNATGAVFYDSDGNGAAAQIQFATVSVGLGMTNNDFQVVA